MTEKNSSPESGEHAESDEPTVVDSQGSADSPGSSGRKASKAHRVSLVAAGAAAVAALVALGVFGVPYVKALTTGRSTAEIRNEALSGAQQVAINLNNADSADLDKSIENMRSSVTGDEMTTYLQTVQDSISDELRNSGSRADTEVVQAALTELNTDDRTATALVLVRVTTTQGNQYDKSQIGMRLGMVEADGVWKAQSVEPIGTRIQLASGTLPAADGSTPAPTDQPAPAPAPAPDPAAPPVGGGDSGGQ